MAAITVLLWIVNVVLETAGQLAFKAASAGATRTTLIRSPFLWSGIACFTVQFVTWFGLISLVPLSQAMLINSINIVAVMIGGRLLFGEKLTIARVAGASLVSFGVALAGAA